MGANLVDFRKFKFLLFCLTLTPGVIGCTSQETSGTVEGQIIVTPVAQIIASDLASVDGAVRRSPWISETGTRRIDLDDILRLSTISSLRDHRPYRAVAIGNPAICGGSWHSWNYSTQDAAATAALKGCLRYREGWERHVQGTCGCRLVMLENRLLVEPSVLKFKGRVPGILRITDRSSVKLMYGMVEAAGDTGQNLPMRFFNDQGNQVCDGQYSLSLLQAAMGSGSFHASCFGGEVSATGDIAIMRVSQKHMKGTAPVVYGTGRTNGGEKFGIIIGVPVTRYEQFRELLE